MDIPHMINWRQVWGLHWPWKVVVLWNCRLSSTACTQQALALFFWKINTCPYQQEFCPPSHGDFFPYHDTSTSMEVVCDYGRRLVMLPSLMPNSLPPIMKIKKDFQLAWKCNNIIVQQSTSDEVDTIPSLHGDGWHSMATQCSDDKHTTEKHVDGLFHVWVVIQTPLAWKSCCCSCVLDLVSKGIWQPGLGTG